MRARARERATQDRGIEVASDGEARLLENLQLCARERHLQARREGRVSQQRVGGGEQREIHRTTGRHRERAESVARASLYGRERSR